MREKDCAALETKCRALIEHLCREQIIPSDRIDMNADFAQIDRDVVVRRDLVHGQLLFAQTIEMPRCLVHHAIVEVLGCVTVLH